MLPPLSITWDCFSLPNQNNSSSETSSLDTDPQAPNQKGTSFSIRSIKLLPNMGPEFCPPRKTSLASYSKKRRWTLLGPHFSPHSNTDSYQTFATDPFSLLTWLHQAFFPFCTSSTRTCLKDTAHIWGPLAYLSKQLDLVMLRWPPCLQALAATTLLIPEAQKLTWNAPLNVCSPHSFKDLLSHQAFLSLPPAWLQIFHAHLLDPSLSFMFVNLLILLAYTLYQIQKQNTYLMTVFRP